MLRFLRRLGFLRGMFHRRSARAPVQLLELYSIEGCPACRRVRQLLTELAIDYVHRSCPRGQCRNREVLAKSGGRIQFPFLVDPNTGVSLYESRDIVRYLEKTYDGPATE